jgi:hypothetical protein
VAGNENPGIPADDRIAAPFLLSGLLLDTFVWTAVPGLLVEGNFCYFAVLILNVLSFFIVLTGLTISLYPNSS